MYRSWGRRSKILFKRRSLDSSKSSEQEMMWFCRRSRIRCWSSPIPDVTPLPKGANRSTQNTKFKFNLIHNLNSEQKYENKNFFLPGLNIAKNLRAANSMSSRPQLCAFLIKIRNFETWSAILAKREEEQFAWRWTNKAWKYRRVKSYVKLSYEEFK